VIFLSKEEIISLIKRNKVDKSKAIVLIADFLVKSKKEAEEIYNEEFCCS
jgi:hypothetical protein